jgi:hypothetical protein
MLHPSMPDPFVSLDDFSALAELERFDAHLQRGEMRSDVYGSAAQGEPELPDERYRRLLVAMGKQRMESSIAFQRQVFGEVLNYWLRLSRGHPHLNWTSDRPAVQLGGDGLMGALAVQLLFHCSRTDGLAVCTSCGTPFLPGARRPRRIAMCTARTVGQKQRLGMRRPGTGRRRNIGRRMRRGRTGADPPRSSSIPRHDPTTESIRYDTAPWAQQRAGNTTHFGYCMTPA